MNTRIIATAVASFVGVSMAETVNPNLWFDGTNAQVTSTVELLEDVEFERSNYWYDYDDRANDNGGSYAVYPFDTTGYYGSLIAPMIKELGYIAIGYVLADPVAAGQSSEYPYNFVGLGFNAIDGHKDPLDMSSTEGLCASYSSSKAVTLEIENAKSKDASCYVTLPATTTPTTVNKSITDFKQPVWVKDDRKLESCASAFKAANAVKFKIDGGAYEGQGILRIFEVGPKGTCTGNKSIGKEPGFSYKSNGKGSYSETVSLSWHVDPPAIDFITGNAAPSAAKATLSGRTLSFGGVKGAVSYEIANVQGQTVKSGKAEASVNLTDLKAGIYMIRISSNGMISNQKILLK